MDKSLLEIAKETSITQLQVGAKAISSNSNEQPRQSLTLSEQEKIFKVNDINIMKPDEQKASDPAIIEEAEAEKQIEEVVAKANRQSPKVLPEGVKKQPSADNEPASGASVHSRNSQKSGRSGKSKASVNSKKSQKSLKNGGAANNQSSK